MRIVGGWTYRSPKKFPCSDDYVCSLALPNKIYTICCVCMPLQEGLEEWRRLGIRPEEVIHALSALTIQEPHRAKFDESFSTLSPITEERPKLCLEQASGDVGMGGLVCEREGGEGGEEAEEGERGKKGKAEGGEEEARQRAGEGGIEEKRESVLSWDADEITEITFSGNHSAGKSTRSGAVSVATSTSHDAYISNESFCSGMASCEEVTDSENSVFSPEPVNQGLVKSSHPLSPSAQLEHQHKIDICDSSQSQTTKSADGKANVLETLKVDLASSVADTTLPQQQHCVGSKRALLALATNTIDEKDIGHEISQKDFSNTATTTTTQYDGSTFVTPTPATKTSSTIDGKATGMSGEQDANSGPIQSGCSKEQRHTGQRESSGEEGWWLGVSVPTQEGVVQGDSISVPSLGCKQEQREVELEGEGGGGEGEGEERVVS